MKVIKRNGQVVDFNRNKISDAIVKAMKETEKGVNSYLADCIATTIKHNFTDKPSPTVEEIQDAVEEMLANYNRFDVAKRYVLYREERAKLRSQGWEMTELQKDIYEKKYKLRDETFDEFLERVSGGNRFIKKSIRDKKFLPAGRILAGRGLKEHGKSVTLSNCYVMPKVDDNIESIFDTAKWLARTYSYGGGCGLNISNLRPKGSKVHNSAQTTTGATSFMELYSMVTGLIGQKGRRGALMLNMDVTHPDILDFIDIKNYDIENVRYANISVNMTHEFMQAVANDEDFELYFRVESTGEEIRRIVKAKEVFRKLCENSWNMAEPAILFQDNIDSWHIMSGDKEFKFAGVNPCAEQPLPPFGSCNLSSINLAGFVKDPFTEFAEFDYNGFEEIVREGVRYLNEILDENMENHPLEQQTKLSKELRQIGLGIMGLADMFIMLGVKYGSIESIKLSRTIAEFMLNIALQESAMLAKEDGVFPRFDLESVIKSEFIQSNTWDETFDLIVKYGLRNSQILTIAPTGSISTMIGVSGGIEPIFQNSYIRKSETLHDGDVYYKVFTPIVKEYMDKHGLVDENDLPVFFVTTSEISYRDRINVQSAWQEFIDASISSTVNLPNETTVEEVEDLYMYAWEKGLKGITIYRDGCSRGGILIAEKPKKDEELEECNT